MANKFNFSEEEKASIKAAVEDLENVSSGEIVPYFVKSSGDYHWANWLNGFLFMASAAVMAAMLSFMWWLPKDVSPFEICIFIIIAGSLGYALPAIFTSYRFLLVGQESLDEQVRKRAMQAFLEQQVFLTKERTGILIFVSELEHEVVVLGDNGINAKVKADQWQEIVSTIVSGIKEKRIANGLINAIGLCKNLLVDNGFIKRDDDTNELSDELRLGD